MGFAVAHTSFAKEAKDWKALFAKEGGIAIAMTGDFSLITNDRRFLLHKFSSHHFGTIKEITLSNFFVKIISGASFWYFAGTSLKKILKL